MYKILFILLAIAGINNFGYAQEEPETSKFLILIENTKSGIKMTCSQGCAFQELTFSLKNGQIQEINQFGMSGGNDDDDNNNEPATFQFSIQKTKDGFALDGIKGTSWLELSFKGSHWINQNGIK